MVSAKRVTGMIRDNERKDVDSLASAFEQLYRENYDKVYNYVRFAVVDADAAEEIVSETFLRAARAFDHFDPRRAKFSTWAIAIARNCKVDYYRRRHQTQSLDDVSEANVAYNQFIPSVDGDAALIEKMLATLSDEERELVYLRYYEDLRNVDIAQRLGMNASTVATKLSRALARMRIVAQNDS